MNITTRVAGLATLALAALPVAALSTAAHAQAQAPSAYERVYVGDLNMASTAGKVAFAHRVDHVARHFCASEKNLDLKAACQAGVRTEANEKAATSVQFASRN